MNRFSRINSILNKLIIVVILGLALYCVIGSFLYEADNWGQDDELHPYVGTWYKIEPSGEKHEVLVPGKIETDGEEQITISTILPESIPVDASLCFRSAKQDMTFYIEGEERFAYSNESTRHTGRFSPVAWVFLQIHPDDAGKELRIDVSTDSSYGGTIFAVQQGSQGAFWTELNRTSGFELVTALFMLLLSVVIIIVATLIQFSTKDVKIDLIYLAFGMLLVFTWVISNSEFRQRLFPNLSIVSDLAFMMILLIPAPFLVYMNAVQQKRYTKVLSALKVIVLSDFVVCTALHALKIVDYDQSFKYMAIVDVIAVVGMVGTLVVDLFKGKLKEYKIIALGVLSIIVCGMVQMVLYVLHVLKFGGMVLALGMSVLLICEVYRTITMLRNVQKEKIEAIQAKEARGKFLANMSHELRTPINSVLGLNTMILRESDDASIRRYASDIQSAGKSLLAVINDILDFSKIESGKMEIVEAEYDFASLIHDVSNMIRPKAEEKKLEFIINVDEELPAGYFGDDVRIKQVLINLLTNAVKYTKEGTVQLSVSGECIDDEAVMTFSVSDTGMGIRPEDLAKLTEEFVRIDEVKNRNIEGTGLGINIVMSLLQMMGSKLEVQSVYGKGSDFYFTLKQKIVDRERIGDIDERMKQLVKPDVYEAAFSIPDSRLLVVDDNVANRIVFTKLLKDLRCPIHEASSGEQCLILTKQNKYDIIFMDHMMPEMDGIETFRRLKADANGLNAGTPVVILTANAISGVREQYLEEGFTDYLSKPIDADALEKMIGRLIPDNKKKAAKKRSKSGRSDVTLLVEDMPFIDGVDWNSAIIKLRDRALLEDAIRSFHIMAKPDMEALKNMSLVLEQSEDDKAFSDYRVKAHSMKSNAATIGANHVAGLAKYLEYAARDKDLETIQRLMPLFEKEWEKLYSEGEEAFPEYKKALLKVEISDKELLRHLDALLTAIGDGDFDRTDEIVEEISNYSYRPELYDLMEALWVQATCMNLEESTRIVEEIKVRK